MSQTIEELRKAAAAIADAANWLAEQFGGNNATKSKPEPKPVKTVTLEEVRAALAEKSRTGHRAEVKALLQSYGAEKLSEVQPERYVSLLADALRIGGENNAR
ncbi:MAG: DNA ligase [Oscillospiraceae bacterium]|nr:DNA ligase [Oscillospiraceae bacterium]